MYHIILFTVKTQAYCLAFGEVSWKSETLLLFHIRANVFTPIRQKPGFLSHFATHQMRPLWSVAQISSKLTRCWLALMSMISRFEIVNHWTQIEINLSFLCENILLSWIKLFVKLNTDFTRWSHPTFEQKHLQLNLTAVYQACGDSHWWGSIPHRPAAEEAVIGVRESKFVTTINHLRWYQLGNHRNRTTAIQSWIYRWNKHPGKKVSKFQL